MTAAKGNGNEPDPPDERDREIRTRLTAVEFRRLERIAQERGESIADLVRGFVVSTIEHVMDELDDDE